jgi:glycosyltransferase involved in cell wall biosynthesis
VSGSVLLAVEQLRRPVPGGVGRYAASLLDGLAAAHAPVAGLLASRHRGPGPDPLARWGYPVQASALPAPLLTLAWDHGLLAPPRTATVVHAVSLAAPPVPRRPDATGPVLAVTVHDLAWRVEPDATTPRGRRWHERALRRALAQARAFVVPSGPVAEDLAGAGADPATVTVIPHGADHLPPPDDAAARSVLARCGVPGGYLLAVGTLEPRKNLARLVAAYAKARPALAGDWPLVVVGPAGWGNAGLGVVDGVVATGPVGDAALAGLYAGARAFAYVPLLEGFGLPPVEAMRCGVPVVASAAVPSVSPMGGDQSPALRVDPRSVDDIATALVAASGDEAVRAALVARGASFVGPLTWRAAAEAHVALWETLAEGAR